MGLQTPAGPAGARPPQDLPSIRYRRRGGRGDRFGWHRAGARSAFGRGSTAVQRRPRPRAGDRARRRPAGSARNGSRSPRSSLRQAGMTISLSGRPLVDPDSPGESTRRCRPRTPSGAGLRLVVASRHGGLVPATVRRNAHGRRRVPIIAPSVNGTKVHRYLTASGGSTAGEPETARRRCFPRRGSRTPAVRPNTSSGPRSRRLPPGRRGGACRTRPTACPRWASDRCYRALDVEAGWTHSQPSGCAPGATRATRRGTTTSGPAAAYRAAAARPHPPAAAPAPPASAASGSGRPRRDRGWPNPSRG